MTMRRALCKTCCRYGMLLVLSLIGLFASADDVVYVDSVNGDDSNCGTSMAEAKKTIDAAYSIIDRHDVKIVLLPGTHVSPSGAFSTKNVAPAYRVNFLGQGGPTQTIIDGGGVRCFTGCPDAFTTVEGCTLTNFYCQNVNWQTFCFVAFSNCVFSGDFSRATSDHRRLFYGCKFEKCTAKINLTYGYDYDDIESGFYYGNGTETFYGCAAFDSVFEITSSGNPHRFDCCSYFDNCFIKLGSITRLSAYGSANILSRPQRFVNTTLLLESATELTSGGFSNCLLGIGDGNVESQLALTTPCVVTSYDRLTASLKADYTADVAEWRIYGYNAEPSETDVALKASILAHSVDEGLTNVSDRVSYAAYKEWAVNVKDASGKTASVSMVNSSPNAYLAYAVNSPTLITQKVSSADARIESFAVDGNGGGTFMLGIKDVTVGKDALADNLAKVFKLEGAPSLSGAEFSENNVDVEFGEPTNGKVPVVIRPKTKASSYFFRASLPTE